MVQVIGPGVDGVASEVPPSFTARVGAALNLNGEVQDDGLPRDSKLIVGWKKTTGPGTVTFTSTDAASTRATFGSPGEYELELSASDGEKSSAMRVKVAVASPALTGGGGN
jgi:hypothetical protein